MTSNTSAPINPTEDRPVKPGAGTATIATALSGNRQLLAETTEQWATRLLKGGMSQRSVAIETGLSRRKMGQISDQLQEHQEDIFDTRPPRKSVLKSELYQDIHAMACRPGGVKRSELSRQLAAFYGLRLDSETGKQTLNMTKDQYQYLKRKIRNIPSQRCYPLFVPEWMPRSNPTAAWTMLLRAADTILTTIDEQISEICHLFPEALPKDIRQELLSLAIDGFGPQPTTILCERNNSIARELSMRVEPSSIEVLEGRPIEDPEFEALCV